MPLYEYICEQDGSVLELLRPIAQADAPVSDPTGKNRLFKRKHSTFAAKGGSQSGGAGQNLLSSNAGGCCPCGKNRGSCSSMN